MSVAIGRSISVPGASCAGAWAALTTFVVIAAWTALVYLPFYALDGPDDSFYAETAHLWTQGLPPYVGAFDIKAPGFFAVLATAELAFGAGMAALRVVTVLGTAMAATAVYRMSRAFHGRATATFSAALYPILFEIYGDAAYAILCAFTALAFLAALSELPLPRRALLAGVATGAACSVKQTAGLEALVLLALVANDPAAKGRALKIAAIFVATASLAPLGFLAYYALRGDLGIFLSDVVVSALKRPESAADAISFSAGLRRTLTLQIPILPVTLLAISALANWRRLPLSFPAGATALWLAAALLAMALQHAISAYYLAPALAPMMLLAASRLAVAIEPRGQRYVVAALAFVGVLVTAMAITLRGEAIVRGLQPVDRKALGIATAAIAAAGPTTTDRLFVVSRGGWLNASTGLAPPTPYFHWFHTLCDFPGAGAGRLAEALAARPRFIVVADRTKRFQCELDSRRALIDDALAASYTLLTRADGDFDTYAVYERN